MQAALAGQANALKEYRLVSGCKDRTWPDGCGHPHTEGLHTIELRRRVREGKRR